MIDVNGVIVKAVAEEALTILETVCKKDFADAKKMLLVELQGKRTTNHVGKKRRKVKKVKKVKQKGRAYSVVQKKAVAARMKKYWAKRRKATKRKSK